MNTLVSIQNMLQYYLQVLYRHYYMFEYHLIKEAYEKAKGHYGRFDDAVKYIDPRKE